MNDQLLPSQGGNPPNSSTMASGYHFPLAIFLIIGPLAGIMLVLAYMSGLFEAWHVLNAPPSTPVEFLGIDVYFYQADPYVNGQDGNTYLCNLLPGNSQQGPVCAWRIEPPPLDIVKPACQPCGIKFSFFWQPFNEIADCTEAVMAGEFIGAPKVTYVIDEDGSLWYWTQENQGNTIFYLPLGIILGLLGGYLLALLWSPLMGVFHKSPPEYWKTLRKWEARVLRLGGRFLGIPCLFYFLVKILVSWRSFPPIGVNAILISFSALLALAGLIVGWRWDITGGVMVLLAFLFSLPALVESASVPVLLVGLLPYLPGVLFLLAGIFKRQGNTE